MKIPFMGLRTSGTVSSPSTCKNVVGVGATGSYYDRQAQSRPQASGQGAADEPLVPLEQLLPNGQGGSGLELLLQVGSRGLRGWDGGGRVEIGGRRMCREGVQEGWVGR